ncbi:MAG TPA: DUF4388 domain-containing protein [Anaeromyxobacteraceae bacterium]|nr:DUF4388 domain-containing protein [Anaeromyxobacteraceae bacterium]
MSTAAEIQAALRRGDPWFGGALAAMPFAELFQLLSSTHRTGELTLDVEGARPRRLEVAFRDGQVVFATSDDAAERLGGVLLRLGVVSAEDLARSAERVREGHPLGQVLVDARLLAPDQLYDALVEQVRAIVLGAFVEGRGTFSFRDGPSRAGNAVKLPERARDLLEAGLRRAGFAARAQPERGLERPRDEAPIDLYRHAFKRIFFRMRQVTPLAAERLNSRFSKIGAADRELFDGVRFDGEGNLDSGRVLVNVLAAGQEGPIARARALAALDGLLAFALFEARNVLPRADSDALWREIDVLKGRETA